MKRSLWMIAAAAGAIVFALAGTGSAQQSEVQDEAALVNSAAANITAQGQYNYNAAAAAVNEEAARSAALENSSRGLREWYTRKQINAEYVAAKNPIPTSGLLSRLAEIKRPDRLTQGQYSRQTRKLNWPAILTDPIFDEERIALDNAFAQRGAFDAGTDSQFYQGINQLCKKMREKMVDAIEQMSSTDSISARKFLRSLEWEARILPGDLGGLATNDR